jgi:hypothetical protein
MKTSKVETTTKEGGKGSEGEGREASVRRRHGGSVHYSGHGGPLTRRHEVRLLLPSWLAPPPLLWPPGPPLQSPQGLLHIYVVAQWVTVGGDEGVPHPVGNCDESQRLFVIVY